MNRVDEKYERVRKWSHRFSGAAIDIHDEKQANRQLARRCALYHTVIEALVPGHGITDNDPERAVVEALERIDEICYDALNHELGTDHSHDADRRTRKDMERARELAEGVRPS